MREELNGSKLHLTLHVDYNNNNIVLLSSFECIIEFSQISALNIKEILQQSHEFRIIFFLVENN